MRNLYVLVLVLCFTSCATFIDKPKEVKVPNYRNVKQCPIVYKVYIEREINYFLGDDNIFNCKLTQANEDKASCKKLKDFSMDWMVTEKSFNNQHNELLKKLGKSEICFESISKKEANYKIEVKTTYKEPSNLLWGIVSGITLAIIPYRTTQEAINHFSITRIKDSKKVTFKSDYKITVWFQLFLLPVQFFIGDGPAHDKMIVYNQELIYEKLNGMNK